jgi:YggT family protein
MLLADWISTTQGFINTLTFVYLALILLYILMSWVRLPYTVWLNRIQRFLYDVVAPYLNIFRRWLPQFDLGGLRLDLSPIVAIIALYVLNYAVQQGLEALR